MNQKCVPGPFPFTSQSLGGAETIWQMPALRSIMLLLEIPLPYIEKNETIFYPPAILRSTCVACRGCLLARSILPQPKQSCSLTMQKPAEQKVIPFIYSGSCWSGQHERWSSYCTQRDVHRLPSHSRAQLQAGTSTLPRLRKCSCWILSVLGSCK